MYILIRIDSGQCNVMNGNIVIWKPYKADREWSGRIDFPIALSNKIDLE